MDKIVEEAICKVEELEENTPHGKHIVTGDIRKLSAQLFRQMKDKNMERVFAVCEELLARRTWALGVIAYDFAFRVKSQYNETTYEVFFRWLKEYVRGWGDCDDFCTHAFGELLRQRKSLFSEIVMWTDDDDFWVRRASAVILIPAIRKNDYDSMNPLEISDRLMLDEHDLVLKGYGWMLKVLSQTDPGRVMDYLTENHERMPRVAYRYAIEKFDKETRTRFMKMK